MPFGLDSYEVSVASKEGHVNVDALHRAHGSGAYARVALRAV